MGLIDKDKIVAEIRERANNLVEQAKSSPTADLISSAVALYGIITFIDTLEVKEVDLEKEINERYMEIEADLDKEIQNIHSQFYDYYGVVSSDTGEFIKVEDIINVAKHFYELGLKLAQKGEQL